MCVPKHFRQTFVEEKLPLACEFDLFYLRVSIQQQLEIFKTKLARSRREWMCRRITKRTPELASTAGRNSKRGR
jgi:hypothetical protein